MKSNNSLPYYRAVVRGLWSTVIVRRNMEPTDPSGSFIGKPGLKLQITVLEYELYLES